MTTKEIRLVDVEQRRNPPKKISDEPRSRMNTSISIAPPQTTRSGPKCFGRTVSSSEAVRPGTRTSRVSRGYDARKMRWDFPNSAGWKETGPTPTPGRPR